MTNPENMQKKFYNELKALISKVLLLRNFNIHVIKGHHAVIREMQQPTGSVLPTALPSPAPCSAFQLPTGHYGCSLALNIGISMTMHLWLPRSCAAAATFLCQ